MNPIEPENLALDPVIRARNVRLGLLLGAIVIGVVVTFMIVFTTRGLPKDPAEWKRLQRLESARRAQAEAIGGEPSPIIVAPTAGDHVVSPEPESPQKKDER